MDNDYKGMFDDKIVKRYDQYLKNIKQIHNFILLKLFRNF